MESASAPENGGPAIRIPLSMRVRITDWVQSAAAVRWSVHPFIGGRYRAASTEQTFENVNPATEATRCRVSVGSAADVDEAVRAARQSFEDGRWSGLPPTKRAEVLNRLADLIVHHSNELALLDSLEMGKPIQAALYDAE